MTDVPGRTADAIQEIARQHGYTLERIVVFGSWVRGDHTERSDIDIVIVSSDWEGVRFYERPRAFLIDWPRDELPIPDIHPLTPEEFENRSKSEGDIIHAAIEEGIEIRPTPSA